MKKKITIIVALMAMSLAMAVAQQRSTTTKSSTSDKKVKSEQKTERRKQENKAIEKRSATSTRRVQIDPNRNTNTQNNKPSDNRTSSTSTKETTPTRSNTNVSNTSRRTSEGTSTTRTSEVKNTNRTPSGNVSRTATTTRRDDDRPSQNVNRETRYYKSTRQYANERPVYHHYRNTPYSREYRAEHYPYRRPVQVNINWTPTIYRNYCVIYPEIRQWGFHVNYRVDVVSAYDAYYHAGEIRTVYGEVREVFYARETDEYILYFGEYYPYHDFTVVVPGWLARRYSRRPDRFFERQHLAVTGLISMWERKPEMVVMKDYQLNFY